MPKINDQYDVGKAFAAIEDELIASMIRNMSRHKGEEIKEDKQWSMWQAEQLKSLEKYKKINQKKYGRQFKDINKKIQELISIARSEGEMDQEIAILEAIRKGFPAKRISKGAAAEFFKLNERKLEALIKATMDDMKKAETAVLRMANDQYRKIIFNAQVYANTGSGTYEKAVDMATKDFLSAGLNCVEYSNGARHTLADYADMAIRTACKRAYLQGEGAKRQEWGIHTVIMNKRGNPCPLCLPFVGKVLIDDVWSGGSKKDGKYPLMSEAVAAGLYHPRCRDSHTTYFPGISTADDTWTKEELEAIGQNARQEAKQQYAERQEKKFGRLAEYSLDAENQKRYAARREEWKKRAGAESAITYTNEPVNFNPENDYGIKIPEFSEKVNIGLSEAAMDVAKRGGTDGFEHMHLVNLKTGELEYYETNEEAGSVGINFWKYVEEHPDTDFAFVHNHNIVSSLSQSDLETPILKQNVPVMIAVQNDGVKYIAVRSKDSVSGFYPDFYYESALEELNKQSRSGKITPTERMKKREEIMIQCMLDEFYEKGMVIIDGRKSK